MHIKCVLKKIYTLNVYIKKEIHIKQVSIDNILLTVIVGYIIQPISVGVE